MSYLYHTIIYYPLLNTLIFFIDILPRHSLGWAIVLLTIVIRIIFFPFYHKSIIAQEIMKQIQPKTKEIQKKYKNDRKKQGEELMKLYRQYKISPWSSFLYMAIQLPVLIALYQILINLNLNSIIGIYHFISIPTTMSTLFLGFLDLHQKNLLIGALAGIFQFVQGKVMEKRTNQINKNNSQNQKQNSQQFMANFSKQLMYLMPIITFFIAWRLPAGVGLFWVVMTILNVVQELWINHRLKLNPNLIQPIVSAKEK